MILSAIVEKPKRRSNDDFKGRHFEASLILQAVCWYLGCPLSCRDIEELCRECGLAVDRYSVVRPPRTIGPRAIRARSNAAVQALLGYIIRSTRR
jgi:transposase, IS6 family